MAMANTRNRIQTKTGSARIRFVTIRSIRSEITMARTELLRFTAFPTKLTMYVYRWSAMMLSASSSSSCSQARISVSRRRSSSSLKPASALTRSSRSKSLTEYHRREAPSAFPAMAFSIRSRASSTRSLKTRTGSRRTGLWACFRASSAADLQPSPLRALICRQGQPSPLPNFSRSMLSPLFRTRSIMFTATTTGSPSSISWVVRYRLRSILVPSTMFKTTSGGSRTRQVLATTSSGEYGDRE